MNPNELAVQAQESQPQESLHTRIEALFNSLEDLLIVFNDSGRILMANTATINKLGYPFELLLIKSIFSLHPDEEQLHSKQLLRQIKEGQVSGYEVPFITRDGRRVEIESRISHSKWGEEDIYFGIFRDVTEQKLAQRKLQKADLRNLILISSSRQLVNINHKDYAREIESVLKRVAETFKAQRSYVYLCDESRIISGYEWADGVSSNRLKLLSLPHFQSPWMKDQIIKNRAVIIRDTLALPEQAAAEKALLLSCQMQSTIITSLHYTDQIGGYIGVDNFPPDLTIDEDDIKFLKVMGNLITTTIRQIESFMALKDSEKRLNYAMQATGKALWDLDLRTNQFTYSTMHNLILGYQDVHTELDSFASIIHPEDLERVNAHFQDYKRGQVPSYNIDYRVRHSEGRWLWLECAGTIVERDEKGKPLRMVGTHSDITKSKTEAIRLQSENTVLKESAKESKIFYNIVGQSKVMKEVYGTILQAAETEANVIIYGESGTGKELVAQAIHKLSPRHDKAFVPVNCGAIPETILESEFFGYAKGAFTGATTDKSGFLDIADGGTLFLDELGELPFNMQVKLLRAIEGSGYTPIGSTQVKKPNLRIVAATNKDLMGLVSKGLMREDFYYRIHVLPITLPPLRKRKEDIPLLIYHFLQKFSATIKKSFVMNETVLNALQQHNWPGNVRELQNVIHRYLSIGKIDFLGIDNSDGSDKNQKQIKVALANDNYKADEIWNFNRTIEQTEKLLIIKALEKSKGNKLKAADILKIPRKTLHRKIERYQISISVAAG